MLHISSQWISNTGNEFSTNITPYYRSGTWGVDKLFLVSYYYENAAKQTIQNLSDLQQQRFLFLTNKFMGCLGRLWELNWDLLIRLQAASMFWLHATNWTQNMLLWLIAEARETKPNHLTLVLCAINILIKASSQYLEQSKWHSQNWHHWSGKIWDPSPTTKEELKQSETL